MIELTNTLTRVRRLKEALLSFSSRGGRSTKPSGTELMCRLRSKHRNKPNEPNGLAADTRRAGGKAERRKRDGGWNTTCSCDDFLYPCTNARTTKIDAGGSDDRSETF